MEVVRTPHYSHHIADEHPIVAFNAVRVPASHLVGVEGKPTTFTQDWFRFERMMVTARFVGAVQRVVDEVTERRAGLRWSRVHARERRRADVSRAAGGAHLGGRQ